MNRRECLALDAESAESGLPPGRCAAGPLVAAGALDEHRQPAFAAKDCRSDRALDLSDTELIVVWLCSGVGACKSIWRLRTGISPAQMSGLVERLRSRGLVAIASPGAGPAGDKSG